MDIYIITIMSKLITLNDLPDKSDFIHKLKTSDILVYEDIQGSTIFVNYASGNFTIKTGKLTSKPLNHIDYTIQTYYQPALSFFEGLDIRVKRLLSKGWWFVFEYFSDEQPANIQYDMKPKNSLILKGIVKGKRGNWTDNTEELAEYAKLLDVDTYPVIFSGKLSDEQIADIERFLNTSEKDLDYLFDETNFSRFFYRILNPSIESSNLMNDGKFQENTEKIIIKSIDYNEQFSIQILNPYYKRVNQVDNEVENSYMVEYSMILINFIEFLQTVSLSSVEIQGVNKERAYVDLMCKLFNIYYDYTDGELEEFNYNVPDFFQQEKFKLNKSKILNPRTFFLIENEKVEWIFRAILGSFHKEKKRPVGVWTETTMNLFNSEVQRILAYIDRHLNIVTVNTLASSGFIPFDKFKELVHNNDEHIMDIDTYDMYDEYSSNKGGTLNIDNVGKDKK